MTRFIAALGAYFTLAILFHHFANAGGQQKITIRGTITGDKRPLVGVTVTAYRDGAVVGRATTNKDGAYQLEVPNGTKLNVEFAHTGWKKLTAENLPGDKNQDLDRVLDPVGEIALKGKVKRVTADKRELVVTEDTGKSWTVTVAEDAKVQLNSKDARLVDLQEDDEISITYVKDGDRLVAQSIRAVRK